MKNLLLLVVISLLLFGCDTATGGDDEPRYNPSVGTLDLAQGGDISIGGTVYDENQNPASNILMMLAYGDHYDGDFLVLTDESGSYEFTGVAPREGDSWVVFLNAHINSDNPHFNPDYELFELGVSGFNDGVDSNVFTRDVTLAPVTPGTALEVTVTYADADNIIKDIYSQEGAFFSLMKGSIYLNAPFVNTHAAHRVRVDDKTVQYSNLEGGTYHLFGEVKYLDGRPGHFWSTSFTVTPGEDNNFSYEVPLPID